MTEAASNAEGEAMPEEKVIDEVEAVEPVETETEKKQAPEVMPTAAHIAQKSKWKERIDNAERSNEAKDRELELLRLQVKSNVPDVVKPPTELDFDSPAEYQQALDKYVETKAQSSAKQVLDQYAKSEAQKLADADWNKRFDEGLEEHYKSAADLKADDFSDTENAAREILGDDVSKEVITRFKGSSAAMLYHLGKNTAEAQRLRELQTTDITGLVVELTRLSDRLSAAPNNPSAPPPDEPLEGGQASTASLASQVEKAREKQMSGKMSMNDFLAIKRQARAAGWVES
ncbi:hypothetical protein [Planktomarina sp.]|uniref:hypothetical protein n=1 Tax=Planktomarina sp. TaxID=2024851 RepID=UPI003260B3B1